MRLLEPATSQNFDAYYQLRWEVLRKPWNQPIGSEKDDAEDQSFHVMALDENETCVGVCRLQFNSPLEMQVRFMGVRRDQQGKGVGKMLMNYMEEKAKEKGAEKIILHARENAVPFYLSIGYKKLEKTFLLFETIQHYKMEKIF